VSRFRAPTLAYGLTVVFAVGVSVSLATLAWSGYRAVRGWQRSATLLAERRAGETANMLVTALRRDMRGAQNAVLTSPHWDEFMLDPPYDVRTLAASAFARYPYPESFFAWRGLATPASITFFNRSDRRPAWMLEGAGPYRFPVLVEYEPSVARALLERIREDVAAGRRFSTFETSLGGQPYQVVARMLYRDALRQQLEAVFGFTVDLAWAREHYFSELTRQVARISGTPGGLSLAVLDEKGRRVTGVMAGVAASATARRPFSMFFFDPQLVELAAPTDLPRRSWTVEVSVGSDPAVEEALRGGNRTLVMGALAAGTLALGVLMTARAARASARLAELRSDFVSSVTHELKTPLATIRAVGDTLLRGRLTSPEAVGDYAKLLVQESKRLSRLVDNLLGYARITDVTEAYAFEPLELAAVIEDVLQEFRTPLSRMSFEVQVDVPPDLPKARGDRTALVLLLENLVDNAIRYSTDRRLLAIRARPSGEALVIEVEDRGRGIPQHELAHVARKFFRGREAGSGGSGLGLTIASRIASDHGGRLTLQSAVGVGTTVSVSLPLAGTGS
jgi:signal transduction histidine kinase